MYLPQVTLADEPPHEAGLLLDRAPAACRRVPATPSPLADLLAADGPQARHAVVDLLVRDSGHEWLAYGILEPVLGRLRPASVWTAHAHAAWVRHYGAQAYHEVDPRIDAAAASSLPVAWTLDALADRAQATPPRSRLRQFVADLGDAGIRSGVSLALPGDGEQRRHFMSLESGSRGGRAMGGVLLGRVLTLGLCLNEYFTRHCALEAAPARPLEALSAVQREILGHVARGESDKRIAHLLCMSSHAVDYHMRKLRHRFAVRNRVQLAQACAAALR